MSKKTETIELRVSPELKAELARRAQAENTTMSGYLRARITSDGAGRGASRSASAASRTALAMLPVAAIAGVLALTGSGAAIATPEVRATFSEMDANGDGTITQDEYRAYLANDIALSAELAEPEGLPAACAADMGTLLKPSSAELKQEAEKGFAEVDLNKDGRVTYEELLAQYQRDMAEEFLALDSNRDGFLTAQELSAQFAAEMADPGLSDDPAEDLGLSPACIAALRADEAAGGPSFGDAGAALSPEELEAEARIMIGEFDTDGDGKLSLAEFVGG